MSQEIKVQQPESRSIFSKNYYDLKELIDDDNYLASLNKEQLKSLLERLQNTQQEYKNFELVVKRDANSLYGSSGNEFLSLVDYDIATDITQTGKHYTVLIDREGINKFFVNWGEKELEIIREFYPHCTGLKKFTWYVPDTENDLCFYGDTDSRYIDLYMIYQLIEGVEFPEQSKEGGDDELVDFSLFLVDKFINKIISDTISEDIEYRNANKGYLKMSHEVTTRKNIVQAKKKYVFAALWKDGKKLKEPKLVIKGVELKKGELNARIKKIISELVNKLLIKDFKLDEIRLEVIKLIRYIKQRKEPSLIYKITSVSNLKSIVFDEKQNKYVFTGDNIYIGIKIAMSWYNFLHKNNLKLEYRLPFEGQKMNFYYDINGNVMGVPDDVNINSVPGLPEPDYSRMCNQVLVKPILRYLKEDKEISEKDIDNFLHGIGDITKL